uniref:Uncharacterized protein n=1 Tax=Solibacter usitatus (strain Ellin6076) TaxID=234267 RepID=Q023Z9_SOLUE
MIGPLWVLLIGLVSAGVFWLPYYVPASSRIVSDSLRFGFNNHVALTSVFLGLAAATILATFSPQASRTNSIPATDGQIGITSLVVVCLIQTAAFVPLYWLANGNTPIGEAAYFLPRLYYMDQGLPPYRGFEFAYGPALAYGPYLAQRLLGVSPQAAYTWSVWAFGIAGYGILWAILRQAKTSRFTKLAAFAGLAACFHIMIAPQYTLLRFLCGIGALVLVGKITQDLRAGWFVLPVIYLGLTLGVFAISPEIGCAFIPGILAYLLLKFGFGAEVVRVAGMYLLLIILVALLIPTEMLLTLRGFAAGGNSFPVMPSPYMLLYLATLFAVVPQLLGRGLSLLTGRRAKPGPDGPFGDPVTIAIGVTSVCMIPGALGRADLGHVYFYGIGVLLLGILGSWRSRKWQLAYCSALVIAFQVVGFVLSFHFLSSDYLSAAGQKMLRWVEDHPQSSVSEYAKSIVGEARWAAAFDRARHTRDVSLETNYAVLAGIGPICANPGDRAAFAVLAQHKNLKPQYFFDSLNVFTVEQRQRMRADYQECRYLIQPFGSEDNSVSAHDTRNAEVDAGWEGYRRYIAWNLCFPWLPRLKPVAEPPVPGETSGRPDFVVLKRVNERWFLWARRDTLQSKSE